MADESATGDGDQAATGTDCRAERRSDERTSGVERLRKSGVGVVFGGLLLAVASTGLPYAWAAALVLSLGLVGLIVGDSTDSVQASVGLLAVGAIALVEAATTAGLGLEPYALAGLAVVFGVFDVVASLTLRRLSGARR